MNTLIHILTENQKKVRKVGKIINHSMAQIMPQKGQYFWADEFDLFAIVKDFDNEKAICDIIYVDEAYCIEDMGVFSLDIIQGYHVDDNPVDLYCHDIRKIIDFPDVDDEVRSVFVLSSQQEFADMLKDILAGRTFPNPGLTSYEKMIQFVDYKISLIQRRYRRILKKKNRAALSIQRAFKTAISNPDYTINRKLPQPSHA